MNKEFIAELWHQLLHQNFSFWGNVASVFSLVAAVYNFSRLIKIHRIVEHEHDRTLDAMKPFDLFDAVRRLRKLLESDRHTRTQKEILKSLDNFSTNLRMYFGQIHGLRNTTDNMYLEMGNSLLRRNRLEEASEYFSKAHDVAVENSNDKERLECLAALRVCSALMLRLAVYHKISEELADEDPPPDLTKWQLTKTATKMVGAWIRFVLENTFSNGGRRVYPIVAKVGRRCEFRRLSQGRLCNATAHLGPRDWRSSIRSTDRVAA